MANSEETLEQVVKRIVDETFDEYNAMKFRTQADAMDAAIRQGIAWAYRDVARLAEALEDEVFLSPGALKRFTEILERCAEEAIRG